MIRHIQNVIVVGAVATAVFVAILAIILLTVATNGIGTLVLAAACISHMICDVKGWLK